MELQYGVKEDSYKVVRGYESNIGIDKLFLEKAANILAVKNQCVAFQVLLLGDDEFSLSVTDSAYFDKKGIINNIRLKTVLEEISPLKCSMNNIGFVEDDDRLYKADILLSNETVYVEKGKVQPVWVEVDVPAEIDSKMYRGRVEIYSRMGFKNEIKVGEVCFAIDVKNVTLPEPSEYSFYLNLWQHNSNIARKHEVALWSNEHFNVIEKYICSLAKLGQKVISVVASEIPWSGQFCYRETSYPSDLYEYSMIKVMKEKDGSVNLDFTAMDRYIDLCFKYGINQEIEVFGLMNIWMCEEEGFGRVVEGLSDGIRVRYLDTADGCFKYIDVIDDLKLYIKKIEQHFVKRALIDKVRIIADEPADLSEYNERLAFLKQVSPLFKYKAAINNVEFVRQFNSDIEDFVPIFTAVCEDQEKVKKLKSEIRGKLSWYVCCSPDKPNTFIHSNLLESTAIGWLTEYMGLDGFLRWNYTVWPEKPRERLAYRSHAWPAGDTNFVYPSNNGAPLLSLRYKAILKGIQAFEIINMLKNENLNADEIINQAFGRLFKFETLSEFNPIFHKRIDELISLDYRDYVAALNAILQGLATRG